MRTREPTKAFYCLRCNDQWDTDPRLAVACPDCGAPVGSMCRRPSGHVLNSASGFGQPHKARRDLAWQLHPCDCLRQWDAAHPPVPPITQGPREPILAHTFDLFTEQEKEHASD